MVAFFDWNHRKAVSVNYNFLLAIKLANAKKGGSI